MHADIKFHQNCLKCNSHTACIVLLLWIVISGLIFGCNSRRETVENNNPEALARRYCASCHLFPEPALLPKKSWETLLPQMGAFYGIYTEEHPRSGFIEDGVVSRRLENLYPQNRLIDETQWQMIREYFLSRAPDNLESTIPIDSVRNTSRFVVEFPKVPALDGMASMVKITEKDKMFYYAEVLEGYSRLSLIGPDLAPEQQITWDEPVVDLIRDQDHLVLTIIGQMNPTDKALGKLVKFFYDPASGKYQEFVTLFDQLQRPVNTLMYDFEDDGYQDFLVCEYGNYTGSLTLFRAVGSGRFQKRILKDQPGALKSMVRDFDQDGLPDIITLFAQGNESISIFYNQGKGRFREDVILQFPPSYGSSHFELADMNQDGLEDIVYVNGDNADFSPVPKPYHGVRIFNQEPGMKFKEAYFYPFGGAFRVAVEDFNQDQAPDLALISFSRIPWLLSVRVLFTWKTNR